MSLDASKLAEEIVASVAESQVAGPEGAVALQARAPGDFCEIWKKVKPILETLVALVKWIPGLGTAAAGALAGLIKVGDQIAAQVCP